MATSDLDLPAIEARAAAATEGPWEVDVKIQDGERCLGIKAAGDEQVVPVALNDEWSVWESSVYREPDAVFIAAARTDVPALVAAVRERDARIGELEGQLADANAQDRPRGEE